MKSSVVQSVLLVGSRQSQEPLRNEPLAHFPRLFVEFVLQTHIRVSRELGRTGNQFRGDILPVALLGVRDDDYAVVAYPMPLRTLFVSLVPIEFCDDVRVLADIRIDCGFPSNIVYGVMLAENKPDLAYLHTQPHFPMLYFLLISAIRSSCALLISAILWS